jgi:hypothetical protein
VEFGISGSVNSNEEAEFSFFGSHFGNVEIEEAYRIGLNAFLLGWSVSMTGRGLMSWHSRQ